VLVQWIVPSSFFAGLSIILMIGSLFIALTGLAAWWFNIAEIRSIAGRVGKKIGSLF
jgi:hypothetical protein